MTVRVAVQEEETGHNDHTRQKQRQQNEMVSFHTCFRAGDSGNAQSDGVRKRLPADT